MHCCLSPVLHVARTADWGTADLKITNLTHKKHVTKVDAHYTTTLPKTHSLLLAGAPKEQVATQMHTNGAQHAERNATRDITFAH